MLRTLLQHEWKSLRRSTFFTQSILKSIGIGFIVLYFALSALGLGFAAAFIIEDLYPEGNVINIFSAFFLIYLFGDIVFRFMVQKFPSIAIHNYLTLNVPKSTLTHLILAKSSFHFFNYLPLFAIIPFFFMKVLPGVGIAKALLWLVTTILFIAINNYLSYYLDRQFGKKPVIASVVLGLIIGVLFLNYKGYIDLLSILKNVSETIFFYPLVTLLLIGILSGLYYLLFNFLRNNAYIDGEESITKNKSSNLSFSFFNRFGDIGKLMQLESKLIWRNKRPRQFLYMSILLVGYPFVFGLDKFEHFGFMIFLGIFLTGLFAMNYATLLISWNSQHFNLILTQNFPLNKYLKSKYTLLALSCVVLSILVLPYCFINSKFFIVIIASAFFNVGITLPMYMYLAIKNSKRIELTKSSVFNYEGMSAVHYLIVLPAFIFPMLIYLIFYLFKMPLVGIFTIGFIGLIGIAFKEKIINDLVRRFYRNRHQLQINLNTKQ